MCTTNIFTYVHPDGRKEKSHHPSLCSASRHGRPCANNVVFQHPTQYLSSSYTGAATHAPASYFPPTPTYTPRSNTPTYQYRSGDESDRSLGSHGSYRSASSATKPKRSSTVYVNGQKVIDMSARRSEREKPRVVFSSPLTPPQIYSTPHSAPSSPLAANQPYIVDAAPRRETRRPVIIDTRTQSSKDRPRVQIDVESRRKSKRRDTSLSSTDSHNSRSSTSSVAATAGSTIDAEDQRRRAEEREEKIRLRIAKANAEIAKRPGAAGIPTSLKRSSTYTRPSVEIPAASASASAYDRREAELIEAVRRLELEEQRLKRRNEKKVEREREEAQRQRLMDRMAPPPRRRATVSESKGGSRRSVLYDGSVYRWD